MRYLFAIALAGCMKIYPSSELPDIDVDWYAENCASDTPDVAVLLVSLDSGSVSERLVPCTDGGLIIEDAKRELFRVDGALLAADGTVAATSSQEVDLRNGIDDNASLYFPLNPYLRVTWEFADGASCESLEADTVDLEFFDSNFGLYTMSTSCALGLYAGYPFGGSDVTVQLRARSRRVTVAVSERSELIEVTPPQTTTVGPLTLVPCSDCD